MKTLCICFLLLGQTAVFGSETAYQALRLIGTQKGHEILNHVLSVEGKGGSPQPALWRIVVEDSSARGGIREFEVGDGRIVSERAPLRASLDTGHTAPMDFSKLNLDSEGVFTIANQEAGKSKIGFDTVDYVLKSSEDQTAPVWVLNLSDAAAGNVGTLRVAADDGKVVSREGFGGGGNRYASSSHRYPAGDVDAAYPPAPPPDAGQSDHDGVGREIDKHLRRAGATLEEFFTGKRTLDRKFEDED